MIPSHVDAYHGLLVTRRAAAKRDMLMMGLATVLAGVAVLITGLWSGGPGSERAALIIGIVGISFAISHLQAYARWQSAKASQELVETLQRDSRQL